MFKSFISLFYSDTTSSDSNQEEIITLVKTLQVQLQEQEDLYKKKDEYYKKKDEYYESRNKYYESRNEYYDKKDEYYKCLTDDNAKLVDYRKNSPLACLHDYLEELDQEKKVIHLTYFKTSLDMSQEETKDFIMTRYLINIITDKDLYEVCKVFVTPEIMRQGLTYIEEINNRQNPTKKRTRRNVD